jgi:hypothetical protein
MKSADAQTIYQLLVSILANGDENAVSYGIAVGVASLRHGICCI